MRDRPARGWGRTMDETTWTDDSMRAWLAARCGVPTHVMTFEPMFQIELCIPPWEQPERQVGRSAVVWGQAMRRVFKNPADGGIVVVAAHHEGNSFELREAITPRPHLSRVP